MLYEAGFDGIFNLKVYLELFTANSCSRCDDARRMLNDIVAELDNNRLKLDYIDVIESIDHAVEIGVLATPALAVNGMLAFCPLPKRKQVLQCLKDALKA